MSTRTNRWGGLLFFLVATSLGLLVIPALIIRPFKSQTAPSLALAINIRRLAPALSIILLAGILGIAWKTWSRSTKWTRTAIVAALLFACASAVMVRQNYFEWMFRPIVAAGFLPANGAQLAEKEMVMTVHIGREERAYPIVQMAYHHILNDTVAGVPIVVTY